MFPSHQLHRSGHMHRGLVTWGCRDAATCDGLTHIQLAKQVARFLQLRYDGRLEDRSTGDGLFVLPFLTVCADELSGYSCLMGEGDFLGGWVPHPLQATKAIAHPLAAGELPPSGWSAGFTSSVKDLTLSGVTAFTAAGAIEAGLGLLQRGDVRLKPINAAGGNDQHVVRSERELTEVVEALSDSAGLHGGLVLEENLHDAETYGIGRISLGGMSASYLGIQDLTRNNKGDVVYGGTRMLVARGDFRQLLPLLSGKTEEIAVRLAMDFDRLADRHLGLVASRRNYDVIAGTTAAGEMKCAVLEQSWRMGGATGAEIAALQAFAERPELRHVGAATVEQYGHDWMPPEGSTVYFHGVDPKLGPHLKYAFLDEGARMPPKHA
ncbi:hypothetical protein At12D13_49450 (plasmid) [Agrobacterium fabrum]|nr:hypothetical protein At12D13_49450 [Agrobacterium fabrum]